MLKLTGFALPDEGILTITAMVNKTDPATVTPADLDWVAQYLQVFYSQGVGKSLAAGMLFPNSGFVQAAFDKPQFAYKRQAWADFVLRGHQHLELQPILQALEKPEYQEMVLRDQPNAPPCAFTGEPAYLRVSRDMFPMISGRGVMNFSAMGEAGLPVSAAILLAIHALPLGCVITQGALLAVESDNPDLMFEIVQANLVQNQRFINLADQNDYQKFPNTSYYKTRLMEALVKALSTQMLKWGDDFRIPSVNAYHFSNYGSNARMTIYALPSSTVQFVWEAGAGEYAVAWKQVVARGWTQNKDESEELQKKAPKLSQRNLVWEALFDLPENARDFLRTYLLRSPLQKFKQGDPRGEYSPFTEFDLISWNLTALFLKRIMNMEPKRIKQIEALGDRLAAYIQEKDDRKLLRALYFERHYWRFRKALLRAIYDYTGDEPLVTFEGYVDIFEAFEEGQDFERPDWNLGRDLLLIRSFEQLHNGGYWSTIKATLQDESIDETEQLITD